MNQVAWRKIPLSTWQGYNTQTLQINAWHFRLSRHSTAKLKTQNWKNPSKNSSSLTVLILLRQVSIGIHCYFPLPRLLTFKFPNTPLPNKSVSIESCFLGFIPFIFTSKIWLQISLISVFKSNDGAPTLLHFRELFQCVPWRPLCPPRIRFRPWARGLSVFFFIVFINIFPAFLVYIFGCSRVRWIELVREATAATFVYLFIWLRCRFDLSLWPAVELMLGVTVKIVLTSSSISSFMWVF